MTMAKLNSGITALFCLCVLVDFINKAAYADKEATSEEVLAEEYRHSYVEVNGTSEELSLESHEAMTRGGEFKPKFTTATASTASNRRKRSYEFLLGLVNNNSKFQVTNAEDDIRIPKRDKDTEDYSTDMANNEMLLEMMVKIAAHPTQWEKVHNLLRKIDEDLIMSKKIVSEMDTALADDDQNKEQNAKPNIEINKKIDYNGENLHTALNLNSNLTRYVEDNVDGDKILQTDISKEKDSTSKTKNNTEDALKSNQWSYGVIKERPPGNEVPLTTRYPWQMQPKSIKNSFPRNFAYHRVTGNPLYHKNLNNNPKAYIAVSVIAPKPVNGEEELVLENELRDLKPWTHNQNLQNMASLRSRWVAQSDKDKARYVP